MNNDENQEILKGLIPAIEFLDNADNPDKKSYLCLLSYYDTDESQSGRDWIVKVGRQETYDFLVRLVKMEYIDPNNSFIIAGTLLDPDANGKEDIEFSGKAVTIFRFLKVMKENKKILYDDNDIFEIEEYGSDSNDGDLTIVDCKED